MAEKTMGRWLPPIEEVFRCRAPVLRHIPRRARGLVARQLTSVIWNLLRARSDSQKSREFLRMFMFARCILLAIPRRELRRSNSSGLDILKARIHDWREGNTEKLWADVKRRANQQKRGTNSDQRTKNIQRAIRLAHESALSKAARALDSFGVHEPTESIQSKLVDKHPQELLDDEERGPPPTVTQAHRDRVEAIDTSEINEAVRRFAQASAGGGSALSPTHLKELLRVPEAQDENGLCAALAGLATRLARGQAPRDIIPWLTGAPLTPLRKRDGGVRPIAVGETIRRLIASILMRRIRDQAAEHLAPHQVGVATKAGCEAIIHAVRDMTETLGDKPAYALLQIDLKNAFNLVSRRAFLHEVSKAFPELLPWVDLCYGGSSHAHLWTSAFMLSSATGVQQGDPLGPFLFAIALKPIIDRMRALIPTWQNEADRHQPGSESERDCLLAFYMDDGVIVGRHFVLLRALDFLRSREVRQKGFYLGHKCSVWWPSAPDHDMRARYDHDVAQSFNEGTLLLRAPIGSLQYMVSTTREMVRERADSIRTLSDVPDAHVAFSMLRACFGTSLMNYALRCVPLLGALPGARDFDILTADVLRSLASGPIPDAVMREFRLPAKLSSSATPHFGLGLTSATQVASAAYLASLSCTQATASKLVYTGSLRALRNQPYALTALARLQTLAGTHATIPDIERFEGSAGPPPTQRELTALIHAGAQTRVSAGDARTQTLRESLALPGAKDWLQCRPCPAAGTHIPDRHFRAWLAYYARAPLRNERVSTCPRPKCKEPNDRFGDHALVCKHSASASYSPHVRRHDQFVRTLARELRRATRAPHIEPRDAYERTGTRPDIAAINDRGGIDAIDVQILTTVLTSMHYAANGGHRPVASRMRSHADFKRTHHATYAQARGAKVVPILLCTTGGWLPESHRYAERIARDIALHNGEPLSVVKAITFQRFAARIITSSAQSLLADVYDPVL